MRGILQIVSWISLFATILPAFLFLAGTMDIHLIKTVMLIATAAWFIITPLWMGRKSKRMGVES